jgi:zinc protease
MTLALRFAQRQVDDGLLLLAVQNPGVDTYAAGVMLDVDMKDEAPRQAGLANLVGDCLDEGTRRRKGQQLAAAVEELGAALEGSSSGGSIVCPAASSRKALRLLAEMVAEPAFPAREVARVRNEVLTEIAADQEDPRTVASLRFRAEAYGPHPYARPARGTRPTVVGIGRKDLVAFHKAWFRTGGGYFAAAGPDPVEQTLDELERASRILPRGRVAHAPVPEPQLPARRREVHLPMKREQVHVFLGHRGVRRVHPDFYALQVMDHVLGTGPGFTSRISRRLRDERGLCYSVNAAITTSAGDEPGCFAAYIGTSPLHRAEAIDGFLEEIEKIRAAPPLAQEIKDVQDYLTGSFVLGLERNSNLVRFAIRVKRFQLGDDFIERYPQLIRAVSGEDVQRVAAAHLHPDRVVIVSAGA